MTKYEGFLNGSLKGVVSMSHSSSMNILAPSMIFWEVRNSNKDFNLMRKTSKYTHEGSLYDYYTFKWCDNFFKTLSSYNLSQLIEKLLS